MSWLSALFGGEDKVTRCGWKMLSIYGKPEDDPYFAFCAWDDAATSEGSTESKLVTLERHIAAGRAQLRLLQSEHPEGTFEWGLGELYISLWPKLVGFFWEGKL